VAAAVFFKVKPPCFSKATVFFKRNIATFDKRAGYGKSVAGQIIMSSRCLPCVENILDRRVGGPPRGPLMSARVVVFAARAAQNIAISLCFPDASRATPLAETPDYAVSAGPRNRPRKLVQMSRRPQHAARGVT
jgi:hypothetical protein